MEKIKIEGIDFDLTRIALGTWAIGGWMWGGADDKNSIKTIHKALEKGINVIDTAPVYGFGHSEDVVGEAVRQYGERDKIAIATKVALEWTEDEQVFRNSSKDRIMKEIEDSLRRLKTDYIDIYQIHWPDESVPFEETAEAMLKLKEQGKIRAIGTSNYQPKHMEEFRKTAPLATNQPPYNLFERGVEDDVLPYMKDHGIAALTYGALCRGMLSGKITKDRKFEGDDLRQADPKFKEPRLKQYLNAVNELDDFAKENYGKRVIHLAVRWILDKGIEIPLWGGRKPSQIDPVDDMFGWKLDEGSMKEIGKIIDKNVKDPIGPEFMAPPENK